LNLKELSTERRILEKHADDASGGDMKTQAAFVKSVVPDVTPNIPISKEGKKSAGKVRTEQNVQLVVSQPATDVLSFLDEAKSVLMEFLPPDHDYWAALAPEDREELRRSLRGLDREGFRGVHVFKSPEDLEGLEIERQPMWTNRRSEHGPFDIIGDVHGCFDELCELLRALNYSVEIDNSAYRVTPPQGRKLIFVGDLVDRGPKIVEVLRLAMGVVASGEGFCVPGNHDMKLLQKLRGKDVKMAHGLSDSVAQLDTQSPEFKVKVGEFLDSLISHYVLDDGKLVVAHAGMKEEMQGEGRAQFVHLHYLEKPQGKRMSSGFQCVTTGPQIIEARQWLCMGILPWQSRNG